MAHVHPSAVVDPAAALADDVQIGPYCVVGGGARLDAGVRLDAHVVLQGDLCIGAGTRVWPFAVLGGEAQDFKDDGGRGRVEIGPRCHVREHVTVHRGSSGGSLATRVGADTTLMVGAHVAHDCSVGDRCVLNNQVHLAGHVRIDDEVVIGGCSEVHQFVRIGTKAFVGGASAVERDVVPYALTLGNRAELRGVNLRGLRRQGVARADIRLLQQLFRDLFWSTEGTLAARVEGLDRFADHPVAAPLVSFLREDAGRRYLPVDRSRS